MPKIPKVIEIAPMSVVEICCYIPAWFGTLATFACGMIAYEASGRSINATVACMGVMSIIPAHLMRSVSGEFDNEAVGMWGICLTFYFWCRSIRTPSSWPFGVLTGLAYIYMVAAWGGFIFVLNMISVHCFVLVMLGRFNSGVWKAYSLYYIIGTAGAIQIPVIGWQPLKSLEQLSGLAVFLGFQILQYCDYQRRKKDMNTKEFVKFRVMTIFACAVAVIAVIVVVSPFGYFAPLGARIRGLFVKHTITGNPLVDSVAEHQPASAGAYRSSLHNPLYWCPFGLALCFWNRNNAATFSVVYAFVAYTFSAKMSRLLIICAPIVSVLAGVAIGWILDTCFYQVTHLCDPECAAPEDDKPPEKTNGKSEQTPPSKKKEDKKGKDEKKKQLSRPSTKADKMPLAEWEEDLRPGGMAQIFRELTAVFYNAIPPEVERGYIEQSTLLDSTVARLFRAAAGVVFVFTLWGMNRGSINEYIRHADSYAKSLSNPQIVWKAQLRDGTTVTVSDYYDGYKWIDENTPKDSRVMAWWDYGYQITGVANRTSIADGNTWNHEHIATLGYMLTSPEKKAHKYIRHMADYVLVWAGGRGDDMGKSPHLARIANSVFSDHCGDADPKCEKFGFYRGGKPTPMMEKSLLYKLVRNGIDAGATVNTELFEEVHKTQYGYMRIYQVKNTSQSSKKWGMNPENRKCDAPGSWYCTGDYPPALNPLIEKRRSFAQIEDFNKKGGEKSAYTKLIEKQQRGEI